MKKPVSEIVLPAQYAPGSFGCHEALHMTSVMSNMIDTNLCEHPAIKQNKDWSKLARKALDSISALYQSIGKEHMK